MTKEKFNQLLDELDSTSLETLKTKNAKYAPEDDALHNFHYGAQLDNSTTAQTIWHYMKKHMVALLDKIERDDWEDIDDVKEKIQDIINYLRFIWCAANEKDNNVETEDKEYCTCCSTDNVQWKCYIEDRSCECCKYGDLPFNENAGCCTIEPCASCKYNFPCNDKKYTEYGLNWEYGEK